MESPRQIEVKPFLIVWCICLILILLVGLPYVLDGAFKTYDFRSFYAAGYLTRTHPSQLYNLAEQARVQNALISTNFFLPFYHPPYEALLFTPFSLLNYRSGYFAFIAFNMLLMVMTFFVGQSVFNTVIPLWQPRPGLMLFPFLPLLFSVIVGQDSILSLLLFCLVWKQLKSGADFTAGCILALALFKFQFVIPIAVLMALRWGWRFSSGFVITAVGVALFCISIVGIAGTMDFVNVIFGATSAIDKSAALEVKMGVYPSAMPNIAGLLYTCGASLLPSPRAFNALIAACSLGVFVWCSHVLRRTDAAAAFAIAVLCGLLVSYHLFIYDLALVLLVVAILAERLPRYLLLALYGLPIVLLPLGTNAFFLMALPVLATLIYLLVRSPKLAETLEGIHATAAQ